MLQASPRDTATPPVCATPCLIMRWRNCTAVKAGSTRETLTMTIAHTSKFSTHFYRCEYFILGIKIRVKSLQFNVVATTVVPRKRRRRWSSLSATAVAVLMPIKARRRVERYVFIFMFLFCVISISIR